jgi:DivIVA domain-containing protein
MAADPNTDETSTQRFTRSASASQRLREVSFPLVMRGYDRHTVDQFLAELLTLVDELESRQTREGVVQKALDELGEETAGILQRAHETADEITERSRSQADSRLQRAEREAEILRRDADDYAEQVIVDTKQLWEERQRLIEDIRQLADEVLGTADDAMERLKLPEQIEPVAEEPLPGEPAAGGPLPGEPLADEPLAGEPHPEDEPFAAEPEAGKPTPPEPHAADEPLPADEEPTVVASEPYQLGAVPDERDDDFDEPEEAGHTVELEALPGGSEEPPERERD